MKKKKSSRKSRSGYRKKQKVFHGRLSEGTNILRLRVKDQGTSGKSTCYKCHDYNSVNRNPGAGTVDKTPEDTQLISTALERKLRRQNQSKGTERSTDSNRSCTREFEPQQRYRLVDAEFTNAPEVSL